MADLGSIGTHYESAHRMPKDISGIRICGDFWANGVQDTSEGDPALPCLRLQSKAVWRFRWAFASGTRTISVRVKQVLNIAPYPTLTVKANPSIGIATDVTATAGAGANWKTIGPVTITPSANGATWVELSNNQYGLKGNEYGEHCFFDHIVKT
jgi:hypothetical protein